ISVILFLHLIDCLAFWIIQFQIGIFEFNFIEQLARAILYLYLVLFSLQLEEFVAIGILNLNTPFFIVFQLGYRLLSCLLVAGDSVELVTVVLLFKLENRVALGVEDFYLILPGVILIGFASSSAIACLIALFFGSGFAASKRKTDQEGKQQQ